MNGSTPGIFTRFLCAHITRKWFDRFRWFKNSQNPFATAKTTIWRKVWWRLDGDCDPRKFNNFKRLKSLRIHLWWMVLFSLDFIEAVLCENALKNSRGRLSLPVSPNFFFTKLGPIRCETFTRLVPAKLTWQCRVSGWTRRSRWLQALHNSEILDTVYFGDISLGAQKISPIKWKKNIAFRLSWKWSDFS